MKLQVKIQGKVGVREIEGPEARATLSGVLKSIGDSILLSTEDGFPEELVIKARGQIKKRAVQTLKQGNPIWDKVDEHGHPEMGCTILLCPPKIIGIIKEDGTWEKVGDGPDQNPFEEKKDENTP